MKKLILSAAVVFSIVSCGKKEAQQEAVTNDAPAVEQPAAAATDSTANADATSAEAPAEENVLVIEANDQMQFDKPELKAKSGKPVSITLKNAGSALEHNFVLLKNGTDVNKFGTDAVQAKDTEYIPQADADQVVAHTKVLKGGESDTITIDNLEPGTYDYICSFPGHYGSMHGQLIVE